MHQTKPVGIINLEIQHLKNFPANAAFNCTKMNMGRRL